MRTVMNSIGMTEELQDTCTELHKEDIYNK